MDTQQLVEQGIAAAKAGKRNEARQALMQAVKADQRNEQAWMWLAAVVDDPNQQRTCLEYVLKINPANTRAQKGLAALRANTSHDKLSQTPQPQQPAAPTAPAAAPTAPTARPPATPRQSPAAPTVAKQSESSPQPTPPTPAAQQPAAHASPPATDSKEGKERGAGGLQARLQTAKSSPEQPASPPPQTAPSQPPAASEATAPPPASASTTAATPAKASIRSRCPYCGAQTSKTDRQCPQCGTSLMERAIPSRRSVALSFLGGMWSIGSVFYIGVQFIWVGKGVQYAIPMFFGALSLGLAVALLQRYRWAYILSIVLALGLFVISVREHFWPLVLMLFLLLGRSYRDFFGKQERFIPKLIQGTHREHYEAGRQYRDRGMWFMAVQEWLEAVQRQPGNSTYLQALGLGYAKIGQFDQALRVLHQALELSPDNGRIQEAIKTIEQQHAGSHA